jgi:hypothetical protein
MNKIKYYKVKSNGEVAKTPQWYEGVSREFCYSLLDLTGEDLRYGSCRSMTLYELYQKVLALKEDNCGNIFIDKTELTLEGLKEKIRIHLGIYSQKILDNLVKLREEKYRLELRYEEGCGKLEFDAYERDACICRYKELKEKVKSLEKGIIYYKKEDEEDEEYGGYVDSGKKMIIEDITVLNIE